MASAARRSSRTLAATTARLSTVIAAPAHVIAPGQQHLRLFQNREFAASSRPASFVAVQGLGFAMHSMWHVWPDLRAGRLVTVLDKYEAPPTAIHAVMPQRRHVPPRVRAFVDFVADRLGDPPPWERETRRRPAAT